MTTATRSRQIAGIARRLTHAGLTVHRSDRSETRYVRVGVSTELRLSGHELGTADYGTRQQSHDGPEYVLKTDESASDILHGCLWAVADEARDYGWNWSEGKRRDTAALIRGLRRALDKAVAK